MFTCADDCSQAFCPTMGPNAIPIARDSYGGDFISAMAFDGDTVAIGYFPGEVYLCARGEGDWPLTGMIQEYGSYDYGGSIALDGDTLVVGASFDTFNDETGPFFGASYVYNRSEGGEWVETAKLEAEHNVWGELWFGSTVALDGDVIVIGTSHSDAAPHEQGEAFVFERDGEGLWVKTAKLAPEVGMDEEVKSQFGHALAVDGKTVVVGAPLALYGGAAYEVYVFTSDAPGKWERSALFTIEDMPFVYGAFGWSVAVEDGTIVVGAPAQADASIDAVYVYQRDEVSGWVDDPVVLTVDPLSDHRFGNAVAIENGVIVAAEIGTLHMFAEDEMGAWTEFFTQPTVPLSVDDAIPSVYMAFDGASVAVAGRESDEPLIDSVYFYASDAWTP